MASQTQDKSRRGSSMGSSYEPAEQNSLRYSSVSTATPDRSARQVVKQTSAAAAAAAATAATTGEKYHRRPELMGVRRKRSGSEFREDNPDGFWDQEQDDDARKAIALEVGKKNITDAEILADLCQWIERQAGGSKGTRLAQSFAQAGLYPPITKHSLSELDIAAIINNPKLRHDVNFDRELHFRPNFDGAKGKFKLKTAEEYWSALAAELDLYTFLFHSTSSHSTREEVSWSRTVKIAQRRIPFMFDTLRDIIKSLVPEQDQSRVDEQLDTTMLMQQIEKGVCDLVSLAKWLSHLLKAHCAPVRDEWVDKMVEQIDLGTRGGSGRSLVNGLRELLGILEAMKLDVANHQIRHLRALLIEDTVNFEQKYHLDRIARRRILVQRSQCWFAQHAITCRSISTDRKAKDRGLRAIVRALLSLLTSSDRQGSFPETLYLDFDRLRALRAEFRDQVYLGACTETYKSLLRKIGYAASVPSQNLLGLREAISAIVVANEVAGTNSNQHWLVNIENIAIELVRHALSLYGSTSSYDPNLVEATTSRLRHLIRPEFGMVFHEQAGGMREALTARVIRNTDAVANSSPTDIFNSLINTKSSGSPAPSPIATSLSGQDHQRCLNGSGTGSGLVPDDETIALSSEYLDDLARRTTHIAVLHWRIWGPTVYSQTTAFGALMRNNSSEAHLHISETTEATWTEDGGVGCGSGSQHQHSRNRRWSSANERRAAAASSASGLSETDQTSEAGGGGMPSSLVYRQR
ncbi:T-complex protein 11-domain-containing protein [Phyllosticta paracitricarpa]|uniref:T-complex protein 11-domain-containing protein n=1 Tax=Phyllosticta paracitricarpa TaxID=2016321 RepID=A0ABR1NDM7_9PEZI